MGESYTHGSIHLIGPFVVRSDSIWAKLTTMSGGNPG